MAGNWDDGSDYEAYVGRWSRKVAPRFLEWLDIEDGLDWVDLGCGAGALSQSILSHA